MEKQDKTTWDVAVIGGGPAGMIAAGRAAENGARVILIEKNTTLGRKLLLTGGGRCNLSNAEMDTKKFLEKFEKNGKFLFSAFSQFGVKKTLDFFNSRGLKTKVESGLRVFPITDQAQSVLDLLINYLKKGEVTILENSPVSGFKKNKQRIEAVILKNGEKIEAKSFILATGGKSHPETGSTGDGFDWLKKIGHAIIEPSAALVPITTKESWVKELQGVSISDAKITLIQNGKKIEIKKGKVLFTHFGLSGPAILNMSKHIGELLKTGEVTISLDLLPLIDQGKLNINLQTLFKQQSNKKLKNCLGEIIPATIAPIIIKLSNIGMESFARTVTKKQRLSLITNIKALNMKAGGLLGIENAIVSSGGIALTEVNFKTMSSRFFSNLYLVGDVLNFDRPSGGFSLQLCWTTGYIAGKSAGKNSKNI